MHTAHTFIHTEEFCSRWDHGTSAEQCYTVWDPWRACWPPQWTWTPTMGAPALQRDSVHAHTSHGTPVQVLIMHGGCHTLQRGHAAASSRANGARRQDFFETSTGSFMKVCQRLASSMGSQACASHSMKQIISLWQQ